MKVSYNWLKDFVAIKDSVETLSAKLTMAGLEVGDCKKINDDWVLEIEITSNRPDWLSHIGIAREIAAITGKKLKLPHLSSHKVTKSQSHPGIAIKLEDKIGCPLYTARIISDAAVKISADLISQRLNILGLRSVNNIVDITNYCLLETGQPVHAFDLYKIIKRSPGHQVTRSPVEIIVRRAKQGEKIVTIDGIERLLSPEILVIADKVGAIAIAGVMGGKDTEVDTSTKAILLESAYFDPIIIRRSRQKLGINTESSYRFERGVHIPSVYSAQETVKELITRSGQKADYSKIFQAKNSSKIKPLKKNLTVGIDDINKLLGLSISKERIKNILISLGFGAKSINSSKLKLEVPDFRPDVNITVDVAEEVARIFGFDKINPTTPRIKINPTTKSANPAKAQEIIKQILCSNGFFEVIPYSLTSRAKAQESSFKNQELIEIANPLSKEMEILQPSLLAGLLDVAGYNFNHSEGDVKIFHIGSAFLRSENGVGEVPNLGILAFGQKLQDWHRAAFLKDKNKFNFFDLKGIIEEVLEQLGVDIGRAAFKRVDSSVYARGQCAQIWINDKSVGTLGRVSPSVTEKWGIRKQDIFAGLIDLKALSAEIDLSKQFKMFSLFPSSKRDISFIVKEDIPVGEIRNAIIENGKAILQNVSLFDEYKDAKLPPACRSLSFSLEFNAPDRTLREDEINDALRAIKQLLTQKFSVTFR